MNSLDTIEKVREREWGKQVIVGRQSVIAKWQTEKKFKFHDAMNDEDDDGKLRSEVQN